MNNLSRAQSRQLDAIFDRIFYCPSCTTLKLAHPSRISRLASRRTTRYQSTLKSSTAINGSQPIPPKFKALHESLNEVRKKAAAHVNLSRLQLAIQSLESSRPTIRLALLGVNAPETARRVARLLLADALEDEGKWEEQLANGIQDFSRGLIIRYGQADNPSIPRPRTSVPVLYIPSEVLQRNSIEILVSTVSSPTQDGIFQRRIQTPSDTFLAPIIGTPTSKSGRQVTISQPAHKCLLIAEGLDQLVATAELLASTKFASKEDRDSVMVAVNLESVVLANPDRKTLVVDVQRAEEGLAAIRKSVTLATEYEHKWIDSGMPALSQWLKLAAAAQATESGQLSRAVRDLVASLLTATQSNLQATALKSSRAVTSRGMSSATKANLEDAINEFSRSAHQELQSGLASAWDSRNWKKLSWYKLFWRADDVGLIVTDLVSSAWLPKTERAVYELSGRLIQVGINPVTQTVAPPPSEAGQAFENASIQEVLILQPNAQLATAAIEPQPAQSVISNLAGASAIKIQPVPQPIPIASTIFRARTSYITDAIASLTTTAQQLVLRTLSITGLSAGLSGLTYVSLFGSIYEAGTIAAVGTVFALWQMQGSWKRATKQMENGLFDEGRSAVVDIVDRMKVLVEQKSLVVEDPVEIESRSQAENAVKKARIELDKFEHQPRNETK